MDVEKVANALFQQVSDYVARALQPINDRIKSLEEIEPIPGPSGEKGDAGEKGDPGKDGESIKIEDVLPIIYDAVAEIPTPENGKDATPEQIQEAVSVHLESNPFPLPEKGKDATPDQIEESVAKYFEENPIPVPQNGKDAAIEDIRQAVAEHLAESPPESGKDATPEDIQKAVADYLAENPVKDGADGVSVTAEDVLPELKEELKKHIESLPVPENGKDGQDGKSVTVEDFMPVLENMQAQWALQWERHAQATLQAAVDRIEKPKDGKDGRDALDLENFELSLSDDERTLTMALMRGEDLVERSVRLSHPIDRGVYSSVREYLRGDVVTFGGSAWIAQSDTDSKPGTDDSWRLSVKKGRDGKDGDKGEKGDPAPRKKDTE